MGKHRSNQALFAEEPAAKPQGPAECLGMSFENDEKRREHFFEILREKLKDPEFRKIEGFPIGKDEDILVLSDPPYYTACPNPFIADFIKRHGTPYDPETDDYRREPFAADVSEGKNDPIYNAHSYHTKVPHKAIMRYILHYTNPGDVVLDGFCGTGMTGVAGESCAHKAVVESLGYRVDKDSVISHQVMGENGKIVWRPFSTLGARSTILNDLCPAATFITNGTLITPNLQKDIRRVRLLLERIEEENERHRITRHSGWSAKLSHYDERKNNPGGEESGIINYVVWSDTISCPECGNTWTYWDSPAVEDASKKPNQVYKCDSCNIEIKKGKAKITREGWYDPALGKAAQIQRKKPVLINYSVGSRRYEKWPDSEDLATLEELERGLTRFLPFSCELPDGFNTAQPKASHGWTHTHHFFCSRTLYFLSLLLDAAKDNRTLSFVISAALQKLTLRNRFMPWYGGRALVGPHPGTLYVPNLSVENDVVSQIRYHLRKIEQLDSSVPQGVISTQSSIEMPQMAENTVDYIFTDPPFGSNIMYSEVNSFWECILRVITNNATEAIQNPGQAKTMEHYAKHMKLCFLEYFRVLKPGRWMTVEFHNSRNAVWNVIGESLISSGFMIADVRILDKTKGTIHQLSNANSVDKDLIITAYKPNGGLEGRFRTEAGTEDGVWDFLRTHLEQLPVFVSNDGQSEIISERQNYMLFDRMVAFHVQRGVTVPLSAAEFYAGLDQRFPQRDGMYFLSDQAAEYDKKRMTAKEVLQLELFVSDEASAIQWLKQQMTKKPQTFQEVHPQFLREIGGWQKHEKPLELSEMLQENFLRYDGASEVPSQIHSYLSTNFRELRNLAKDDPALKAKAKDRWYVPDPNKAGDLEKLRDRALMREFRDYRESKQKRLKVFRLEAVRAGFRKAWQEADYGTIIAVAEKIPENVLQEDPKLLMWYDQAVTRTGGE
jgi:DNA modification methylase